MLRTKKKLTKAGHTGKNVLKPALRTFFFISAFAVSLLLPKNSNAQFLDTIEVSLNDRPTFTLNIDSRNTFIGNRRAEISGIKIGLKFSRKFRIGVGYSFLASESYKFFPAQNDTFNGLAQARLKFSYANFFADYVFHRTRKWEFTIGLQGGLGESYYGPDNVTGRTYEKRPIMVYEPTITGEYMIWRWLGFSGKYGYRVVFGNQRFSAPIYAYGFSIYWMTIYRGARDWINRGGTKRN